MFEETSEQNARNLALQLAHNPDQDPATVTKRAEAYHAFLTGNASLPATSND